MYYARVIAYCADAKTNYTDTVYSSTFVIRRTADATSRVVNTFPNPFGSIISMNFNDVITKPVHFQVFNVAGQLMIDKTDTPNNVFYDLPSASLANGIYLLNVTLDGNKPQTFKLLSNN